MSARGNSSNPLSSDLRDLLLELFKVFATSHHFSQEPTTEIVAPSRAVDFTRDVCRFSINFAKTN